jgi:predicted esterase
LKYVTDFMNENGPFDGILGFSMGGSLSAMFASNCLDQLKYNLKFMIIVGAPLPLDEKVKHQLHSNPIQLPAFFIHGEKDEIIPIQRGEALMACFTTSQMHKHSGGHGVPLDNPTGIEVNKFLTKFIE